MASYPTRLLVLGVVRIFEPAHGYLLLQELNSWEVGRWAKVKPGSIYSALRTLTKDGFLETVAAAGDAPAKATYRRTAAGRAEFDRLLRSALTAVEAPDMATTMAAISFMPFLPRAEVLELLQERRAKLRKLISALDGSVLGMPENPGIPPHVVEMFLFPRRLYRGDLAWTEETIRSLNSGKYSYAGEPPDWTPPENDPIWGQRA